MRLNRIFNNNCYIWQKNYIYSFISILAAIVALWTSLLLFYIVAIAMFFIAVIRKEDNQMILITFAVNIIFIIFKLIEFLIKN